MAEQGAEGDRELVDKNLGSTVYIYTTLNDRLKETEGQSTVALPRKDVLKMRRAAIVANQSVAGIVKGARARENRLVVEQHLLRQAAYRDRIDRDAHRARIFERMRERYESAPPGLATNAAPDRSAIDRVMRAVAGIESSLASLSPTGAQNLHGVGMFAAKK